MLRRGVERDRAARLSGIMALLTADLAGFRVALLGQDSAPKGLVRHADPVFLVGDPAAIATQVYAADMEVWRLFAEMLRWRLGRRAIEALEPERAWLRDFVDAAHQLADGVSLIKAAQMRAHLERAFDFVNNV